MGVPEISKSKVVHGFDEATDRAQPITITEDGTKNRLDVSASVSGVAAIDLSETDDEVAVYGGVNGSETADAATRQIINVDASGRVRQDLTKFMSVDPVRVVSGSAAAANADVIASTEVFGSWVAVQVSGTWSGTITFQGSNDNTNFSSVGLLSVGASTANASSTTTANGIFHGPASFRYFRARMTAYSSGTAVGDATFSMNPSALTALGATVTATGNVSHDAADSGNPLKIGAKAIAHGANPTAVAASDRTDLYANRHGIPFVIGGHPNIVSRRDNYTAAQTDAAIVTVGAGSKIVVTQVMVTSDGDMTAVPAVRIGFGTASTPTGVGVVASHPGVLGGTGFVRGDGSGILGVGADNEDLRITCDVPTGGSLDVVTSYYTIES